MPNRVAPAAVRRVQPVVAADLPRQPALELGALVLGTLLVLAAPGVQAQSAVGNGITVVVPVTANTASYSSEITVTNLDPADMTVNIAYYDAVNTSFPGAKVCTPLPVPAGRSVAFTLAGRCTLEPSVSHFGLMVLTEATASRRFHAYNRTQNPQGIGFSVEGFPANNLTDQLTVAAGLKRKTAAGGSPAYQTNCFAAALEVGVSYELRLVNGTTGAQIGSTVAGTLAPFEQRRYLDVFGASGANAPAGDYENVLATFTKTSAGEQALLGFCTVQDNTSFGADFRIAKSLSPQGTVADDATSGFTNAANVLAGSALNTIAPPGGSPAGTRIVGATVAGGGGALGVTDFPNRVQADFGTVGGGLGNLVDVEYGTVGGGRSNNANGLASTIAGGQGNFASWNHATVGGGNVNAAVAPFATVGGGNANIVWGTEGSIAGGANNQAVGNHSTIGGGTYNNVNGEWGTIAGGTGNSALLQFSAVGGGWSNAASGEYSVVAGGHDNDAQSNYSAVSGGRQNVASAVYASVAGGWLNQASGAYAAVGGGYGNLAAGSFSVAAGRQARNLLGHDGVFLFSDSTGVDFDSARSNEFAIRAAGGLRIVSARGIALDGIDRPFITRGFDAFDATAPQDYQGHGRWGMFMENSQLTLGIPALANREFRVAKYNLDGTRTMLVRVDQSGNLYTAGSVNPPSDAALKTGFAEVSPREILARVVGLPVTSWTYRNSPEARHIGPTAQDFRAAFGLGSEDTTIATVDADGVALAAIQGLYQVVREREAEIAAQAAEIAALKARLDGQQRAVEAQQAERLAESRELAELRRLVEVLVGRAEGELLHARAR